MPSKHQVEPDRPPEPAAIAPTQKEVAAVFSVSVRTVKRWLQRGAPPRTAEGYDLRAIRSWVDENLEREGVEVPGDIAELKRRKLAAEVGIREADRRIRERQLELLVARWMSSSEVRDGFARRIETVKRGFLLLPRAAARDVVGLDHLADIETKLEEHVRDVLGMYTSPDLAEEIESRERAQQSRRARGRSHRNKGKPRGPRSV